MKKGIVLLVSLYLVFAASSLAHAQSEAFERGAMTFIIFVALFVIGCIILAVRAGPPKSIKTSGQDKFMAALPEGFQYSYYNDNTGYAINVSSAQVYLYPGHPDIFDISNIRNIERRWITPEQHSLVGRGRLKDHAAVMGRNQGAAVDAYNQSGLFISLANIDKPMHQIKFVKEADLLRSYEILSQALESRLPKESLGNEGCPQCGTAFVTAYIEDGSTGDWCPKCGKSLLRMKGII